MISMNISVILVKGSKDGEVNSIVWVFMPPCVENTIKCRIGVHI